MDIGWYRTTVKSYEREVFIVPNNIFSTTVVLNISRKKNEWRMYVFNHVSSLSPTRISPSIT
jgi:MscS family membrane protein